MKQPWDSRNNSKHHQINNSSTTSLSAKQISNDVKLNHNDHPNGLSPKSISINEGLCGFKRNLEFAYNNPYQVMSNKILEKERML